MEHYQIKDKDTASQWLECLEEILANRLSFVPKLDRRVLSKRLIAPNDNVTRYSEAIHQALNAENATSVCLQV